MKTKFFFFLAMLLMSSVGAFAQNETNTPLKGDLNEDGKVDAADVVVLVDIIMKNGGEAGGDAIYYWYAGPDMLTSVTVPGTNADNECGYGWHVIEGNPTSIETGELGTSDCEKINWVLAVPTKFGLNAISNGEDITDAYDVSTVTTADGIEYRVFRQISATKKTDIIFVKGNDTGEQKYYWYSGQENPMEMTSISPIKTDYVSGGGWFEIGTNPEYISGTIKGGTDGQMWYEAIPSIFNFVPGGSSDPDATVGKIGTVTINNMQYDVWECPGATSTRHSFIYTL